MYRIVPWFAVVVVGSCLGGESLLPLGAFCSRDDECEGSLVCQYGRCRLACVYNWDCPEGQICI